MQPYTPSPHPVVVQNTPATMFFYINQTNSCRDRAADCNLITIPDPHPEHRECPNMMRSKKHAVLALTTPSSLKFPKPFTRGHSVTPHSTLFLSIFEPTAELYASRKIPRLQRGARLSGGVLLVSEDCSSRCSKYTPSDRRYKVDMASRNIGSVCSRSTSCEVFGHCERWDKVLS